MGKYQEIRPNPHLINISIKHMSCDDNWIISVHNTCISHIVSTVWSYLQIYVSGLRHSPSVNYASFVIINYYLCRSAFGRLLILLGHRCIWLYRLSICQSKYSYYLVIVLWILHLYWTKNKHLKAIQKSNLSAKVSAKFCRSNNKVKLLVCQEIILTKV